MMGVLAFRRVFAFRSKALAVLFVNRTSSIVTEIWICNGKWRCVETVTRCVQAVTSVRRCVETVTRCVQAVTSVRRCVETVTSVR